MARDDRTLDMFEVPAPQPPISADHRLQVCDLVSRMLKESRFENRFEAAGRMSSLARRDFSKLMLDAWSAESREDHNIPLYAVPALEAACESTLLSVWLVSVRGGKALFGREVLNAELGRLEQIRTEATQHIRLLKNAMGEKP